jgi:hypothetical protein
MPVASRPIGKSRAFSAVLLSFMICTLPRAWLG